MTPARLHAPPLASGASARIAAGPPAAAIFCNLLRAKNPIHWPSGDQNGWRAPDVPASGVASPAERSRTNNCAPALGLTPAHAIRLPSGDTAGADHRPVSDGSAQLNRARSRSGTPIDRRPIH